MIAKLKSGSGFAGLIDYANDLENKNTNIITAEGLSTSSPKAMAACMHLQAKSNLKVKNYVGHCMLSFSPKDTHRLTDGFVEKIARDYLRRMGIVNTQFAIYRHHDQPHGHVHIVYNRVDNNGNEMKHDTNFKMSASITQAMTREYGLHFGQGKKDVRRERLRGRDAAKYRFYDTITPVLERATSWDELRKEFAKVGITFNLYYSKDGKAKGISFSDGTTSFGGKKIDRSLGYWAINATLRQNAQQVEKGSMATKTVDNAFSSEVAEANDNSTVNIAQSATDTIGQAVADTTTILEDVAGDANSAVGEVVGVVAGMVMQATEIQPSVGGGGGSSKLDDDDEKEKNKYRPRRKR